MSNWYWVKEYILVFIAYGVVMFVWPEIVFKRYLRGKSFIIRVCFDAVIMPSILYLFVLFLGICHILYPWVVRVLFWGGLLAGIVVPYAKERGAHTLHRFVAILDGGYGIKSFVINLVKTTRRRASEKHGKINSKLVNNSLLYVLLFLCICYGLCYFGIGSFESHSFGFGDMYRHQNWIYEMTKGTIFYEGIYPAAMHTFVYAINVCFGISTYSVLLFLQPIHVALFLLAIFLLAREIFNWRYTAVIVLTMFVTAGCSVINTLYAFSRLQWTLPQEFAAPAALLCPLFLLRYLKNVRNGGKEESIKKLYRDENIIVFALALFVTIATHFYCTIIAFFLCLAIVLPYIKEITGKKQFGRLLLTIVVTTLIAVLPMAAAIPGVIHRMEAEKEDDDTSEDEKINPFQGSIDWAVEVIKGENVDGGTHISQTPTPEPGSYTPGEDTTTNLSWVQWVEIIGKNFIRYNYGEVFDGYDTEFFLTTACISLFCLIGTGIAVRIIISARKKRGKSIPAFTKQASLVALLFMLVNLLIMCEPGVFGLPRLIASSRLGYYVTAVSIMVAFIPIDLLMGNLNIVLKDRFNGVIALVGSTVVVALIIYTGNFHGALYFELTRYNSAVDTTVNIIKENDDYTYTIVSTTDETWQVSSNGYHEELMVFASGILSGAYKLPTEKVYIFLEKQPLHYAQWHFPSVPSWLANNYRSQFLFEENSAVSVGESNIIKYQLRNGNSSQNNIVIWSGGKISYSKPEVRIRVESNVMEWVKDFEKLYPRTLKVYFENDDFVCYYFEQNPSSPYELGLKDIGIVK